MRVRALFCTARSLQRCSPRRYLGVIDVVHRTGNEVSDSSRGWRQARSIASAARAVRRLGAFTSVVFCIPVRVARGCAYTLRSSTAAWQGVRVRACVRRAPQWLHVRKHEHAPAVCGYFVRHVRDGGVCLCGGCAYAHEHRCTVRVCTHPNDRAWCDLNGRATRRAAKREELVRSGAACMCGVVMTASGRRHRRRQCEASARGSNEDSSKNFQRIVRLSPCLFHRRNG